MVVTRALHDIEIRIIGALQGTPGLTEPDVCSATGLSPDQVRRGIEWLRHKGLASVSLSERRTVRLGEGGLAAARRGLPERQLLDMVGSAGCSITALRDKLGDDFGPALGAARGGGWVRVEGGSVLPGVLPVTIPAEDLIRRIGPSGADTEDLDGTALASLRRRPGYLAEETSRTRTILLTAEAEGMDTGSFGGSMDVEAEAPAAYPARRHLLMDMMEEIREAFVALGFTEVAGGMAQTSFWNFDALFTPQDHPAREMQDTFFLDGVEASGMATASRIRSVARSHRQTWGNRWSREAAEAMVLRTHTTCVTIKHLAESRPEAARVFSLGRVFRNEKVSYKHLVEFHQIEGVVTGPGSTLRDLMGIQKEFYRRIGLNRVKFWPTFFPYTEPSLQSMVYSERLGRWIELFGMGIFRPQVTGPLGIRGPVLAWGGGIERIAMLRYGMDDVREFYANNMGWLRGAERCP